MSAQSEARLIQAVHAYLNKIGPLPTESWPWPQELAELTAWEEPS